MRNKATRPVRRAIAHFGHANSAGTNAARPIGGAAKLAADLRRLREHPGSLPVLGQGPVVAKSRTAAGGAVTGAAAGTPTLLDVITGNSRDMVLLHKTGKAAAENICSVGFEFGAGITGMASFTSQDPANALRIYESRHRNDTHVVVLTLPRAEMKAAKEELWAGGEDVTSGDVASYLLMPYYDPLQKSHNGHGLEARGGDRVPSELVRGYIERATGMFFPNPNYTGVLPKP
ncbi:MAG: hypothetical protein ACKVPX_04600 [Myxococcaceae bacterium]